MSSTDDLVKLSFFTNIGKAISAARTLNETLEIVMEQIGIVFAPTYWSLLLKRPATGDLRFAVVIGSGVESLKDQVLPKGTGVAGWIAETGSDVIIEDVSKDHRFDSSMDEKTKFTTKSIIGVPLKTRKKVFGVIELINKLDGTQFTPFDLSLLRTIADFAAIAIEKAYYVNAIKRVASIDALTGLYNRRSFQRFLDREIERAKRTGSPITLMMFDIDRFKEINDSYGHTVGDRILTEFAEILRTVLRKADIVCRFGGDEFIVIMPEVRRASAEIAKKRILEAVSVRNKTADIRMSASVGTYESVGSDISDIVRFVDEELYNAKARREEQHIEDVESNLANFAGPEPLTD